MSYPKEVSLTFQAGVSYCRVDHPAIEKAPFGFAKKYYWGIHVPSGKWYLNHVYVENPKHLDTLIDFWSRAIPEMWDYKPYKMRTALVIDRSKLTRVLLNTQHGKACVSGQILKQYGVSPREGSATFGTTNLALPPWCMGSPNCNTRFVYDKICAINDERWSKPEDKERRIVQAFEEHYGDKVHLIFKGEYPSDC